ncbi:MAG: HAMP domain-containing protein, partial [Pirellulales bacterium]|nr:HAMP domain-containing protein [Pirellulales bacterium]
MSVLKRFRNLSMKIQLIVFFLAVGVIPMAVTAWLSYAGADEALTVAEGQASESLQKETFDQLVALRNVKKKQIEQYLSDRQGDMAVLVDLAGSFKEAAFDRLRIAQQQKAERLQGFFQGVGSDIDALANSTDVAQMYEKLLQYHIDTNVDDTGPYDVSTDVYKKIWEENGKFLAEYAKTHGYSDMFIVCAKHGHVMYSAGKKSDLGENLGHGTLRDSGLAQTWARVLETKGVVYNDFAPYAPLHGDQTAFIGAPIQDPDGQMVAVIALQIQVDPINAIVQQRAGLGTTGETYLVGRKDGQTAYRSDRVVQSGKIGESKGGGAVEKALAGNSGFDLKTGNAGATEIEGYAPLNLVGFDWCIITTMSFEEALATKAEGEDKDFFAKYTERRGYYDLFLMHPDGQCFYTVSHEPDYGTNLVNGKYKDTNLGELTRQVLQSKEFGFADFAPYAPSNGAPAAFIGQPVLEKDEVQFVVALQLSLDTLNAIMKLRAGMGETGETYLVGPDKRMRSDSFLDPKGHSVAASFAGTVENNGVDTEAVAKALAGKEDAGILTDYNGNPVLSAYTPIDVFGTTWALLAEVDQAEAFAPVQQIEAGAADAKSQLLAATWIIAGVAIAAVLVVAYLVAGLVTGPVKKVAGVLDLVAKGDYNQKVEIDTKDEIGRMAGSLNTAIDAVAEALQDVKDAAEREKQAQAEKAEEERQRAEAQRREVEQNERKVKQILEVAELVANRNYTKQVEVTGDDALGQLGDGLRDFFVNKKKLEEEADRAARIEQEQAETLRRKVDGLLEVVAAAAEGDLTREVHVQGDEPVDELAAGIQKMLADLSNVIGQVTESAAQFNEGSRVIAESSQSLASGAQTQSSSVEEVSASVEELTASIDGVKNNAHEADAVAKKTSQLAEHGGQAVKKSTEAMELIRTSSDQIAEIIQVISEIASQTNLLALNAAI